jgi:hypothetical protein
MANEKMTLRGFKWDGTALSNVCEDIIRAQPFSDTSGATTPKHYGMPIDRPAAKGMIGEFYRQFGSGAVSAFKDVKMVDFSKASIFRILSQEGCEYIRFFFCIADVSTNKASLVMEGLDSNLQPIGGKGLSVIDSEDSGDVDGQYEEKGNGENGDGNGNVVSLYAEWTALKKAYDDQPPLVADTAPDLNKLMEHVYTKMSAK